MPRLWYDIIDHRNGWAIVLTPAGSDAFPNKKAAFDAAIDYARKLRFLGYATELRMQEPGRRQAPRREQQAASKQAKAS